MFGKDKGKLVLIVDDCRDGATATGKYGIHEGDMPIAWVFSLPGHAVEECSYTPENEEIFKACGLWSRDEFNDRIRDLMKERHNITLPMNGGFDDPQVQDAWDKFSEIRDELSERIGTYSPRTNPRIRLEDGSVIWGYECWWKALDAKLPEQELEKVLNAGQQDVKLFCTALKELINEVESQSSIKMK